MVRLLCVAALLGLAAPARSAPAPGPKKVKVEVVFCLDTTGSMGGLIDGAKAKIWSICNQIAGGKPTPDLKVGLVAYRDKGDEYVTRLTELTADLDTIHGELKKFTANGGGDGPEHVNQALYDAVHKFKWSDDKKTLKIIFLVGDAEPHMDYADDVKYPVTCKVAKEKGILINAVLCGTDGSTEKVWREVASLANGSYVAIPQDGGVRAMATPFDVHLAGLNRRVTETVLVWGDARKQKIDGVKNATALDLPAAEAGARIAFQAKNGQAAAYCLLDEIKQKRVKLEDLKPEEMPEPLKKLTAEGRKSYLTDLDKKREAINGQILRLDQQRSDWVAKKVAEEAKTGKTGFDVKVLEVLRAQAKGFELEY